MQKYFLLCLALLFFSPQLLLAAETNSKVNPCRQAWNDKMQEYDEEYEKGLNTLLFQKETNSQIIDSEAISYNLRSHNCKMHQICEAVQRSLFPSNDTNNPILISGIPLRCEPQPIEKFGGVFESCSNTNLKNQTDTLNLWKTCSEQAAERIEDIEIITENEVKKSSEAKKSSNFIEYLVGFNQKLEKLSLDFGDLIGKLFAVTREMTCVQKNCQ